MPNAPLISVLLPCYNHEAYIGQSIESALEQDLKDCEILVSDNASPDRSWEIIQRYKDPRLKIFRQPSNIGAMRNGNFLYKQSKGKYLAALNADDYWLPGKLRKQVEAMESNPEIGACFTWAELVYENDPDGAIKKAELCNPDIFKQANRSRGQWLLRMFLNGNCLSQPSSLVTREAIEEAGGWGTPLAFRQLADYRTWLRILKRRPIHVVQEVLTIHRRTGHNESSASQDNVERLHLEDAMILKEFFDGMPDEVFLEGFRDVIHRKDLPMTPERIKCEQTLLALAKANTLFQGIVAMESLYLAFDDAKTAEMLERDYKFGPEIMYKIAGDLHGFVFRPRK